MVFGGTSVSSPIIAGVYALAGNAASVYLRLVSRTRTRARLLDVTARQSTAPAAAATSARRGAGYDGPTGLGVPAGSGAF